MAAPVSVDTVLAPVDGSEASMQAAEYALAIAERYGASVHILSIVSEDSVRAMATGELEPETVANRMETFVESLESIVPEGVTIGHSAAAGFSLKRKTQHPGSVILDVADEVDADFLVIPREPLTGRPDEVLSKSAEYVLLYASQPVLSV
ncbi:MULTISPECIES: universal stress protein [unclassified Haladaptatus]|uniref:universal stress protein n=1 Tax=unclassified Haladaptatus TaxID=2622732 RepID=UPI0023E899B0|nr:MULTISPECIES: universal stress protein [unclassified Haladaptatus]